MRVPMSGLSWMLELSWARNRRLNLAKLRAGPARLAIGIFRRIYKIGKSQRISAIDQKLSGKDALLSGIVIGHQLRTIADAGSRKSNFVIASR